MTHMQIQIISIVFSVLMLFALCLFFTPNAMAGTPPQISSIFIRAWYDATGRLLLCRTAESGSELTADAPVVDGAAYSRLYEWSSLNDLIPVNAAVNLPVTPYTGKCVTIYKKGSTDPNARTITVNCLGDSITNGYGSNTDPADEINAMGTYTPYYRQWENSYEITARNYGQNGSFVAKYTTLKGIQSNTSIPFVQRYPTMSSDADIVTVLGGVNDCQAGYYTEEEFGSLTDPATRDKATFCGALRSMLEGLKAKYPNALIVYLTPLKYSDKMDGLGAPWENAAALPHYVDAIKAICQEFEVPVIDLYHPKELHFCDDTTDKLIYGDRLHFGWKGHKTLSEYIIRQLEAMNAVEIIE